MIGALDAQLGVTEGLADDAAVVRPIAGSELTAVRNAGLGDAEIAEVVADVALNVMTNDLNILAETELDFPAVLPPVSTTT